MSYTDIPIPQNEAVPCIGLDEEASEDRQPNIGNGGPCQECVLHGPAQSIQEEEAERPVTSMQLNGKEETNSQASHEDPAPHWDGKEDLELQQWSDGSSYRGHLTMNMKLGVGEFTWANGESYSGEFYKDHHHGRGVYSWPDGSKFIGSFYLSRKEGYGTMTFTDGRRYQGLYKSDERFGPGIETYSDGSQDVGIWMEHHLFRLCTLLPDSVSFHSNPQFKQFQQPIKKDCGHECHDSVTESEERIAEDPFMFRYKTLLLDDSFTLPEKVYSYSSDTDHLPITPTQHLEFDQHFYRSQDDQQEKYDDAPLDMMQPSSGIKKIYLHVNTHRNSPEHLRWEVISIMNGDRAKFGPKGPREQVAEQLIVAAGHGDYEKVSTILRHDLAHVDVSDSSGLTALHAAAVNGHNNVINLLLDNGADVNKSNDEGLSALSLCLMLFYGSKPYWPNVAERNLPPMKKESNDGGTGIRKKEGNKDSGKDEQQKDTRPVSEMYPQTPRHLSDPVLETDVLDSTCDSYRNLRATINLLLLRGADPNLCTIPMHPLFFAVKAADVDTVQLLLECGSHTDVRLTTQYGSLTPLHIAAALPVAEGIRITEILLCAASDPNASAEDDEYVYDPDRGESPGAVLGFPMRGRLDSGLPLYNYYDKSPHVQEKGGRTPLHVACERDDNYKLSRDIVLLLISHNAKLNTLWSGHSPLSLAIASGNDLVVKELLASGADPNMALGAGIGSALCVAVSIVHEKRRTLLARIALIDRLIKSGANILMPILIGEGKRTALGTATDYAYYKYFQDKKIAHTPYHALSPEEKDIYNARKQLLEHLGKLTREAVTAKEREWEKDGNFCSSSLPDVKMNQKDTRGEELLPVPRNTFFRYCYHCGRSVGVKLAPCLRCYRIFTCSQQCKKISWAELHKDECLQLSGKLSGKITSGGKRSSPSKSLHADLLSFTHGPGTHNTGEWDAATTENYSYN
ncbi:ankyrin repeat and MYND domain-containing protein 1 [Gastrophryne carolinensis]